MVQTRAMKRKLQAMQNENISTNAAPAMMGPTPSRSVSIEEQQTSLDIGTGEPAAKRRRLNGGSTKQVKQPTKKRAKRKVKKSKKKKVKKQEKKATDEKSQIKYLKAMERELMTKEGYKYVVGVDEAGRGPLAGPVVVAACHVPLHVTIPGIQDSKAATEEEREKTYEELIKHPEISYGVAVMDRHCIDKINILQATLKGMRESVGTLQSKWDKAKAKAKDEPETSEHSETQEEKSSQTSSSSSSSCTTTASSSEEAMIIDSEDEKDLEQVHNTSTEDRVIDMVLVDGNRDPCYKEEHLECRTVIKGDANVYCIAAASIIAKVTRDRMMVEYDKQWPEYGFAQHKGYPTPTHKHLVWELGPCPIHRRSFRPVKDYVKRYPESGDESGKDTESKPAKTKGKKTKKKRKKSKSKQNSSKM